MKKFILIVIVSLMAIPVFSQFVLFEKDSRFPTGQKAIPFMQMQWDQKLIGGFSTGPFFATTTTDTTGWNEVMWYVNYEISYLSFGVGFGYEHCFGAGIQGDWTSRFSPWIKIKPQIGDDDPNKKIEVFSLWEFGEGHDNYWYTNSITYETKRISFGALGRRFYGVGPILGLKLNVGKWKVKLSGAPLYDMEDNIFKPTVIFTVTN